MLLTIKRLGQISGSRWNESSIFKSMWYLDKMEKVVEYHGVLRSALLSKTLYLFISTLGHI